MISAPQVYRMLGNESLWQVAQQAHAALAQTGIPHAIMGGVAVCLHGYQRNTIDIDLLIRRQDQSTVAESFSAAGLSWSEEAHEFQTPAGIPVQILLAGDRAGKGSDVMLPDPAENQTITQREGLPVLTLARLIECKLACGEGEIRRTHKDFADVVELIACNHLKSSFARFLHKSLRSTFQELAKRVKSDP
jgi:hypothetical protein